MSERPKTLTRVRSYWEGLRLNGALPQRTDIDPRDLPGILANTFLIERMSPGVSRFRLAGAVLSEVMGMDVRGMPFLSLMEPAERPRLADRVDQVFRDPSILDLVLESDGPLPLGMRLVLMPVQSLNGVDMALGCLETEGLCANVPRRFHLVRALQERILDGQVRGGGFADPPAAFGGVPKDPAPRPALRLVHSSDHKITSDDHGSQ